MPEEIGKLLNHTDVEIRIQAVKDLKKHRNNLTVILPFLIKSLEDDNWRVRKTAIEILLDIRGDEVIKELINVLYREDSVNARNSAIEAIVLLGYEATDHLINAFKTPDNDIKKFIVDILGSTRDPRALPLLLKAVEDEDDNVRAAAVEHLGNIKGNVSVVNALISILNSGDMWAAYPAADALGRIGDARAVDSLVSVLNNKSLKKPAIRALGQISEIKSLTAIVPFLDDSSKIIREETVKAIQHFFTMGVLEEAIAEAIKNVFGGEAINMILPHTQSSKKEVKDAAILLLGLFKEQKAVAPLLEMAEQEDIGEAIGRALVFIGKSNPEALIPFFTVSDSYQRRVLCEVAGKIGDNVFFKHLASRLKDEDGHVRARAAVALSNLKNSKAVTYIKPLLLDEYEDVQESAIKGLSRLKEYFDLDEIIIGLSDKNPVLRKNSAILLGFLREQGAVEALGTALKDSDVEVRVAVVEAMGSINGVKALKSLVLALADEYPEVRRIAAISMGRMRADEGVESLILLLSDSNVWVRAAAAGALGNIGNSRAIEPLIRLMDDESGFVMTAAIEALGKFKDHRVKDMLIKLLNDDDAEIRSTVVEALAIFDGISQDIIPLLKDKDWSVRKKVVDILGRFFRDESYAYLRETANIDEDAHVREAAARYLCV